jgi:hypothetical protein
MRPERIKRICFFDPAIKGLPRLAHGKRAKSYGSPSAAGSMRPQTSTTAFGCLILLNKLMLSCLECDAMPEDFSEIRIAETC